LYRFGVITAYCSYLGHFAFSIQPLGGLGTTYDVHLELIGKRVVDFLLMLIKLFALGVTAESLRAKRDRKSLNTTTYKSNHPLVSIFIMQERTQSA